MTKWKTTGLMAAILAVAAGSGAAQTSAAQTPPLQTFPNHIVRLVVPYTAGGPIDVTSRIVAKRLGEALGQPVVVENRPGGSGVIGNKAVAAAEPDGHTLLVGNTSTLAVYPAIARASEFDEIQRLTPVAKLVEGYEVMVVDPAGPAATLPAFIAYAKAHPGELNYGSAGHGNLTHVGVELLQLKTGIDMQHVPYKGATEAITALLAGQVQMSFTETAGALPLARQGKVRALAIASEARDPRAPDLPTFIELGVPDFVVETFTAVMAPAGTPSAIVDRLNGAINVALADADTRARLENLGLTVHPGTIADFSAFLAAEHHKWEAVVTRAGIRG
jgi:tripartite-type tricarboxylate transporter receptor subunit TctC